MTNPKDTIHTNRLAQEKSPYLLQHANNPVDWYPWSDEAFEKAHREDKPIFLSIGYSTCHWCHVMAHESFEDKEVADLMNETFVSIKVDREERPDIDGVYMQVAQMMTGGGGWPLTIIMTPDKKPFYTGTYIPKQSRLNMMGLVDLIPRIDSIWKNDKENIKEVISRVQTALQEKSARGNSELTEEALQMAFSELSQRFDEKHGGFGRAPKFPSPHNLMFLLRYWKRTGDDWALQMVEQTLIAMRNGGVFDQIGYGFHRYSTDAQWFLPHFEKMLYDQASLILAYAEAYQITKNPLFSQVIQEIFEYVTRDMMSLEGGFFSAEDADSEGVEGKFYTWSLKELEQLLMAEETEVATKYYGIRREGNFQEEATGENTDLNILHVTERADQIADSLGKNTKQVQELIHAVREKLVEARLRRTRPHRDEKILTDWNSFMIAALAKAGVVLQNEKMISIAESTMKFLLKTMLNEKGELYHRYRDGEVAHRAFLDDYAYLVWGLLELYESTFNPYYLEKARDLSNSMLSLFWDQEKGGLYFTGTYSEKLLLRRKNAYDGAIPSGNSVAVYVLIRLARLLGKSEYEEKALEIIRFFSDDIHQSFSAYSMMLIGLDFILGPAYEIVIAGDPEDENTMKMVRQVVQRFLPRKVILLRGTAEQSEMITKLAPFTKFHQPLENKATAHVCINHNCKLPTTDVDTMLKLLGE